MRLSAKLHSNNYLMSLSSGAILLSKTHNCNDFGLWKSAAKSEVLFNNTASADCLACLGGGVELKKEMKKFLNASVIF